MRDNITDNDIAVYLNNVAVIFVILLMAALVGWITKQLLDD